MAMQQVQQTALANVMKVGLIRALYARAQITEAQFRKLMEQNKA